MGWIHRFFYLLIFVISIKVKPTRCEGIQQLRIINGVAVRNITDIPFQVSLQRAGGFHFCGGSIITRNHVLTAAHCVTKLSPANITVVCGMSRLLDLAERHNVRKIIRHRHYEPYNYHVHDIAILVVQKPFNFSENVSAAALPKARYEFPNGTEGIASGWGSMLGTSGPYPNNMQKTTIKLMDHQSCSNLLHRTHKKIYLTQLCANNPDEITGPCFGDSGGPLIVDNQVVGVASFIFDKNACGSTEYPTVFTKVAQYREWITKAVKLKINK